MLALCPNHPTTPGSAGNGKGFDSSASRTTSCPAYDCCSRPSFRTYKTPSAGRGQRSTTSSIPYLPCSRIAQLRPIDDKLWTLTARRPLGEWVFAEAAARQQGLTIHRGVQVKELVTGAQSIAGVPHVVGVKTTDGRKLDADLVIDAAGRQSPSTAWLAAIGARAPYQEQADSGFTYYTRYFSGKLPQRNAPTLSPIGTISILTLPGDNDTWSVTIFTASSDQPLKRLRHEELWTKTIRACPIHAHWLD